MTTVIDLFRNTDEYIMYEPGQTVFEEGQPADVMYAVIEGEIEITLGGKLVNRVGLGGIIGEMALIDDSPRNGIARAKTVCKLVPVSQKRITFLAQQAPYDAGCLAAC